MNTLINEEARQFLISMYKDLKECCVVLREQALSLFDYLSSGKIILRNERECDEMLVLDLNMYGKNVTV